MPTDIRYWLDLIFYWTGAISWSVVVVVFIYVVGVEVRRIMRACWYAVRLIKSGIFETLRIKYKYRNTFTFFFPLFWSLYWHPRRAFADDNDNLIWWPGTTQEDKIKYHRDNSYYSGFHEGNFWEEPGYDLDKIDGGKIKQ